MSAGNRILADEVAALRSEIVPKLARMEEIFTELLVMRPSRAQQAKKAGVHPATLRRREKRLALKLTANGSAS